MQLQPYMVTFHGRRSSPGEVTVEMHVEGVPRPLPLHTGVYNHSPCGFEWGYAGSGPAQLALAICVELVGPERAMQVSGRIKEQFIAPIKANEWMLRGTEVMAEIATLEADVNDRGTW
jgi:hypothetical protein